MRDSGEVQLSYASRRGRWVLMATVLGSAIASIDATVAGVALPGIGRDFGASLATLQWVVTAYTLTLTSLLLLGGTLADRYGRRRIFLAGVVWFAVASLVCGLAPDATVLVAARAVQGIGAALMTPGSLAIIEATFVPADRGKAIGAWSGLSGVATAIGPFLGGWFIQAVSWRLIFIINLPLAVATVAIGVRCVPDSHDPDMASGVDAVGAGLVTIGLAGATYGLIEGPTAGWGQPASLVSLLLGVAALAAFAAWEHRARMPMLRLSLFASKQFTAANAVTFAVYGALGGVLFLLPIELQQVSGYSALQAGIALLPVTVIMLALSAPAGTLAARIGPRAQMSVGPAITAIGLAMFARLGHSGDYLTEVLPPVMVYGLGLAITVTPLTSTVLAAVPGSHAGMASAVNNTVARASSLIAVAVLPAAAGLGGMAYLHPARFSAGFGRASLICAGLCLAGGVLAAITIRNPRPPAVPLVRQLPHCALDAPPAMVAMAGRSARFDDVVPGEPGEA